MKKQESSDKYSIYIKDVLAWQDLSEEEMFDTLEDLAQQYYEQGHPDPLNIKTVIQGT